MASIITATTSSGLTQSADLSGVLQLASGTGNLVTVPSVTGTAMVSGNMPAFSAYASSAQSVSSGTFTKVTFSTEDYDTNNNFASSRFTPTVAGYYQINVNGWFESSSNVTRNIVAIYKNGSSLQRVSDFGVSNAQVGTSGSMVIYCNGSSDYIEVYIWMTATGTLLVGGNISSETFRINGSLIRAA
jgi:hypothetical protein